jgi:hypothetical protein
MPRTPTDGVGQVDDHVPGGVESGGGGPGRDGLARADLAGDHAEGVLVDAPADAGDRFGVPVVAVQHRRGQAAAERHTGETPVRLQASTHWCIACSPATVLRASSMDSCPGDCPSSGGAAVSVA